MKITKINVRDLTREEMLEKLYSKAEEIVSSGSWDDLRALEYKVMDWNLCRSDEEEILLTECYVEDGYDSDGFLIEDTFYSMED